ncbi:MAG: AraC family transcriptional regulator [Kiritimatiellia bacterium]
MTAVFDKLLEQTLRFEYQSAGLAPLKRPHSTGWRVLPGLMLSQAHQGSEIMYLPSGEKICARAGELIVLPAGARHKVDVASPRELRRWAHVNYFILGRLDLFSLMTIPPVISKKTGEAVGDLIRDWLESTRRDSEGSVLLNARRNGFGFRVLGLLAGVCPLKVGAEKRIHQAQQLRAVIEYTHQHYHEPLRRDDLARMAGLSSAQFHCLFKEITGFTPIDFVRHARIRHAQELLITTGEPVKIIAAQCGYEDEYVFSKSFKRCCGFSPRQYRFSLRELRTEHQPASPGLPPLT